MKNPNRQTAYLLFIVLISFTFEGCIFDSEDEDMVRRYKIVTYGYYSDINSLLESYSSNHPLEIELTHYPPQERFKGRVKIMKYGWLSIDENASGINKFEVPGRGKFGNGAHKIIFVRLTFNESEITGTYGYDGGLVEYLSLDFRAIKID